MTHWLLNGGAAANGYNEVAVVFANTGQENEQTLEFVRNCDERLGFGTVWIEAVQYPGQRKRPGFRIIDFNTADRNGVRFEEFIAKYGIPNYKFKDCTRSLKRYPIQAYARQVLGWADYTLAIGIRADEMDRVSTSDERSLFYPFATVHPVTKPGVNIWWQAQNFRLELKGYQGNCKWCWKKSLRKHLTILSEHPEHYDFPQRMEKTYGLQGPEFRKDTSNYPLPDGYHRVFFRGNVSTLDLRQIYEERKDSFKPAEDDADVYDETLDIGSGCEESCEVFGPDDANDVEEQRRLRRRARRRIRRAARKTRELLVA